VYLLVFHAYLLGILIFKGLTARRLYDIWYIYIYILTAIGLTSGGSSTSHIYTRTIHIRQRKSFGVKGLNTETRTGRNPAQLGNRGLIPTSHRTHGSDSSINTLCKQSQFIGRTKTQIINTPYFREVQSFNVTVGGICEGTVSACGIRSYRSS
jgi:hypothetical protein